MGKILQLYQGVWRRFHATHLRDRRFDQITAFDEVVYIRLHLKADDYGRAELDLLHNDLFITRASTPKAVPAEVLLASLRTLEDARFVKFYEVPGVGRFVEIIGFIEMQPRGLNGKRVMRCPPPPAEGTDASDIPCYSEKILSDPRGATATEQEQLQTHNEKKTERQRQSSMRLMSGERESPSSPSADVIESIYSRYPKQTNKKQACKSILQAVRRLMAEGTPNPESWLIDKVNAYAAASVGIEKRYLADPKKWFDDARYNDDPEAWQRNGSRSRQQNSESDKSVKPPLLVKTRAASHG